MRARVRRVKVGEGAQALLTRRVQQSRIDESPAAGTSQSEPRMHVSKAIHALCLDDPAPTHKAVHLAP